MKKLLPILLLVFTSHAMLAQENQLDTLQTQKAQLEKQIKIYQDSLKVLDLRIKDLQAEREASGPELLQNEFLTNKKLPIRISPDTTSTVLLEIKKQTPVLKIDHLDGFYLVCFDGTCGYIPDTGLQSKQKQVQEEEIGI